MQETPSRSLNAKDGLSNFLRDVYLLTGAIALATAVRLYLFANYYTINNDGVLYIEAARNFWSGDWIRGLDSFYPPLYPLMIAVAFPITSEWELAGQFWPLILGVLIIFPLFGLLRVFYGQKVALVALFFYGVSPYLARLSLHVRSEIPYIFFLVLALYFLQRGIDGGKVFLPLLAGLSAASAYLVRSEGVGLIIVGTLFLYYRGWLEGSLKKRGYQWIAFLIGFALFAFPYVFYLKWDTGSWLMSRKAGVIVAWGLADYDPEVQPSTMTDTDHVSATNLIASRPLVYAKKVASDAFRSLGVYFEAVHFSYLPFLLVGWFFLFKDRWWEKREFFLFAFIFFYLAAFAFLYVNRRYAVPLVPLSLGWVGAGYLVLRAYIYRRWSRRGYLIIGCILTIFLVGTLPKTLKAIGREKLYLRQAGTYLKGLPGIPKVLTNDGRVAFYARGQNHIRINRLDEGADLTSTQDRNYLALDGRVYHRAKPMLMTQGWILAREFSTGGKGKLIILRR